MGASFELEYLLDYTIKLLPYIRLTLLIVFASLLLGVAAGILVALPRLYKVPVLEQLSQLYISFFRGTPILIQLFLFYYGLPEILKWFAVDVSRIPALYFVILTYSLHSAAYLSEMIRFAVEAIDRGQVEAAYSTGMSGFQAFTRIVCPQAVAVAMPVFANLVIATLKDTSLAFSLGIMELTGKSHTLATVSRHFLESYLALALIYFVIAIALEQLFHRLEKRLLRYGRPMVQGAPQQRSRLTAWLPLYAQRLKSRAGGGDR